MRITAMALLRGSNSVPRTCLVHLYLLLVSMLASLLGSSQVQIQPKKKKTVSTPFSSVPASIPIFNLTGSEVTCPSLNKSLWSGDVLV